MLAYLGFIRQNKKTDKSAQKNAEQEHKQLLQSRYASMGEMVSNIIHQWREPLGAVGAIQSGIVAKIMFGQKLDKEELLEAAQASTNLLKHLSETMETFYGFLKNKNDTDSTFSIKTTFESIKKIMAYSLERDNIALSFTINGDCVLEGQENEFLQALINIIINARDILIHRGVKNRYIAINVELLEKSCIISVKDNGGGIDVAPIEKVFEPYVSTKGGSGIGLYMSKTIIEQRFGGSIKVKNTDEGALFTIETPHIENYSNSSETLGDERINKSKMISKVVELEYAQKEIEKCAEIFKQTHWGIVIYRGMSSKFEKANPAFLTMFGYSRQEAQTVEASNLLAPESLELAREKQIEALINGFASFDAIGKRKDGSTFDIQMDATTVKDTEGDALYRIVNIRDISAEKMQKKLLDLVEFAINNVAEAAFLLDENGKFYWVNGSACSSLGYTKEELLSMSVSDMNPNFPAEKFHILFANQPENMRGSVQTMHKRKDGSTFFVEAISNKIRFDAKMYSVVTVRDITERKRAEEALRETVAKLTNFASVFPGAMYIYRIDKNWRASLLYASDRLYEIFGVEKSELERDGDYIIKNRVHPDDKERLYAKSVNTTEILSPWYDEFRIVHPEHGIRWIEWQGAPQIEEDGYITRYGIALDVTGKKKQQWSLELVSIAIDNVADGVYLGDKSGNIQWANAGACNALGYSKEELTELKICDIDPNFSADMVKASFDSLEKLAQNTIQTSHKRKDGSLLPVEIRTTPVRFDGKKYAMSIVRDITERKNTQKQLKMLEAAVNNAGEAIYILLSYTSIVYVNSSACKMLGYTYDEFVNMSVYDLDAQMSKKAINDVPLHFKDNELFVFKTKHKTKDGRILDVQIEATNFTHDGVNYGISIVKEVTPNKSE